MKINFFKRYLWIYLLFFFVLFWIADHQPFDIDMVTLGCLQHAEITILEGVQGRKEVNERGYLRAINYYEELLILFPSLDYAYGNMGFCRFYLKQYSAAHKAYDKAIELNPNIYTYVWDKGMIFFHQKEYRKAILALEQAIQKMSQTLDYYKEIIVLPAFEFSDEAKNSFLFKLIFELERDKLLAEVQIVRSYYFLGDFDKASKLLSGTLPSVSFSEDPLQQKAVLKKFLDQMDRYWWERMDPKERVHFDSLIGPLLAKILVFSKASQEKQRN